MTYNKMIEDAEIKGRKEGFKQGMEKGSKDNSFMIAKNLLNENIDIDIITKEEIEKL